MPGRVTESERHDARRNWLTTKEAGELIGGVTDAHVRALIAAKKLTALDVSKPGGKNKEYRLRPEWVEAYVEQQTSGPDKAA